MVQKKPSGDDVDGKTPFVVKSKCGLATARETTKGGHSNEWQEQFSTHELEL